MEDVAERDDPSSSGGGHDVGGVACAVSGFNERGRPRSDLRGVVKARGVTGPGFMPMRCPRLRRSPVDGWATYVATSRVLTREGLVNRELLDVRGSLQLGAGGGHRGPDPRLERVEVLA